MNIMLITPVNIASPEGETVVNVLLDRFQTADSSCQTAVDKIVKAVRERKDEAVIEYCRKLMLIKISPEIKNSFSLEMTEEQITELESSRKEIENLRKLTKDFTMEREHWLRQTELLRSSFSWRITGPLRSVRRFQLQLKEIIKSRVQP